MTWWQTVVATLRRIPPRVTLATIDPKFRRWAEHHVYEGPDRFFYVRDWGCALDTPMTSIVSALGVRAGYSIDFVGGLALVSASEDEVFLVPFEGAVFVFGQGFGFTSPSRLRRAGGSAYTMYLDHKRGITVGKCEQEGRPLQTLHENMSQTETMKRAKKWGPNPETLVLTAPEGELWQRRY